LPARIKPTRARDAEADADVADAAALSSYRPWVPGQQKTGLPFSPTCLDSHGSYVRCMCLGLPQWRATRTQIEEPARHRQRASNNLKSSASGRLPPARCRRQPRLAATLDADSQVATALLVRFAHARLRPAVFSACLPFVGRQRSTAHGNAR
jgi:hypothetical protein